ncbi:site-specific DNA-methyltransferase [Pseudactinotalea sp. Z1748]|uniref:site-specific DNA-methyltransferase n=1 Tax=Pseudactinotalea sp. Z1748 TaxID=3413027 RepID=UPI003C7AFDAF
MSRLTELLRQARKADPQLGADLEAEIGALTKRRTFGLVFERHQPEAVELPGRQVRRGDKVRVLPSRGEVKAGDQRLWRVARIERTDEGWVAHLVELDADEPETQVAGVQDLVFVAAFRDRLYPGLVETGRVERGGADKPFHTVINAENYHALEMLTYTHRGKVDAIYIDPPYNTGARDWKYNNNYVEGDDDYRHSKWLAFMERRLKIARDLLNPDDSVLIVTIDEKEVHRLGLLLEQTFPDARIQMISTVINPAGVSRGGAFGRLDEYIFIARIGAAQAQRVKLGDEWRVNPKDKRTTKLHWSMLNRTGTNARRTDRPNLFYPIFLDESGTKIVEVGEAIPLDSARFSAEPDSDRVAVWPIRRNGSEGNWQISPAALRKALAKGYVRVGRPRGEDTTISYLKAGERAKIENGTFPIVSRRDDGSVVTDASLQEFLPGTAWRIPSHDSSRHGSSLVRRFIPNRRFPFPKSLYAVEDALRFFVKDKPDALVLDFFAGSGTTAHAVMRLNKQDGGRRKCISVTNNEVSAEEQHRLRKQGLRPGDPEWEALGICDYITKPRVTAAITGKTPESEPIKGEYRFTDEFPMAQGFAENAAFFTLTYESPLSVKHHRAFERIAPMLWLRAGAWGRVITDLGEDGWDVADSYAVLENVDQSADFLARLVEVDGVETAFIVTDDDSAFQMVCRDLPAGVRPIRLYESYLQNFQINSGRDR